MEGRRKQKLPRERKKKDKEERIQELMVVRFIRSSAVSWSPPSPAPASTSVNSPPDELLLYMRHYEREDT